MTKCLLTNHFNIGFKTGIGTFLLRGNVNAKVAVLLKKKERLVQCEVNSNVHSACLKLKGYIHLAISGPFNENST